MSAQTITLARKKTYSNDLNFSSLEVTEIYFKTDSETPALLEVEYLPTEIAYKINGFGSLYTTVENYVNKNYTGKTIEQGKLDGLLYQIQKRLITEIENTTTVETAPVEAPIEDVIEEAKVEIEEAPKPKVEAKKETVKIELKRPEAVGLEAQLQNMVFDALESDFTTQTIQNKMIQLGIEPNKTEIVVKAPGKAPKNVGAQHKEFKTILQTISAKVNIALVGPAGSGKTTTVKHVANALSLPFYSKSVSAQTGVHEFFGYQDANGNYVRTLFRDAYEKGGVFLLDEFDAGNPNVLASMNQATANGECAFADGMVKKHDDFIIVMAGNTYGHGATIDYVGRNKIDGATLDRFAFIHFGYDEEFEYTLATNKSWCKEVQMIRKRVADKKIKTIVSPRATFDGAKLLEQGMSIELVKNLLIYKGLSQDEITLLK